MNLIQLRLVPLAHGSYIVERIGFTPAIIYAYMATVLFYEEQLSGLKFKYLVASTTQTAFITFNTQFGYLCKYWSTAY